MEKTEDTVQREIVMVTLRWMGVLEADIRLMEGERFCWSDDVGGVKCEHWFDRGKLSQSTHVYHC